MASSTRIIGIAGAPVLRAAPVWAAPLLLFSLQLGGANVSLSGRAPVLLVFDLVLTAVLFYLAAECVFGDFWPDLSDRELLIPAALCFAAQWLSALANPGDVFKSVMALKIFACAMGVYVLAVSSRGAVVLLRALVLFGGVTGVTLLYSFIAGWAGVLAGQGARALKDLVELPMGFHNYLAAMLVLLLPLSIGLARSERGKWRLVCYGCAVAAGLGLVITMSRGAFVALTAATVLSFPLLLRAGLRGRHIAGFLVVVAALVPLIPRELFDANTYLVVDRIENTDVDRLAIYRLAWDAFLDNPLLGVGPGQVVDYTAGLNINDQRLTAHNVVLNSLSEMGLLGAIPFLWWIALILRRGWRLVSRRCSPLTVSIWVGLLAAVLANLVDDPFAGQHYLVLFCAFAAAVTLLHRQAAAMENLVTTRF